MKIPRRNFLHLMAGAAAVPAVSHIAGAQTATPKASRELNGLALMWAIFKDWLRTLFGKSPA